MQNGGRSFAVTGAFGFTGRAIAAALVERGDRVLTLTNHPRPADPLASRLSVAPLAFDDAADLARSLSGVEVLINTYWLRFPRESATFERALVQTGTLLGAARSAGVRRIVHVSVVGADPTAATPYVRAKGVNEAAVRWAGMEWAIVRPTLTFGPADILVNNMAWALRRLPLYGIPGLGRYPIQPVHVEDVARICLELADGPGGQVVDAAGPDTFEYRQMVAAVRSAVGSRALVAPMPGFAVLAAARLLGLVVRDVVLTRDELLELTTGFLTSKEPPRGRIRFADWVTANGASLGRRWSSELARNYARRV
jgi:nucleoside-diphosphate-sugar epimerase